jgi:hypothetical protein
MTSEEKVDQLAEKVRRLEQRHRRLTLLFPMFLLSIVVAAVAYTHFGQALGWNPSAHEVKANHLVVRTIDLVDLDGNPVCHIYAHKAVASDGIEMDIRAESAKALITLSYDNGNAKILWSGAADAWQGKKEIGK